MLNSTGRPGYEATFWFGLLFGGGGGVVEFWQGMYMN